MKKGFLLILVASLLIGCSQVQQEKLRVTTGEPTVNQICRGGPCRVIPIEVQNVAGESTYLTFKGVVIVTKEGNQYQNVDGSDCFFGGSQYNTLYGDQLFPNGKRSYNFCFAPEADIDNATLFVKIDYDYTYSGLNKQGGTTKEYSFNLKN